MAPGRVEVMSPRRTVKPGKIKWCLGCQEFRKGGATRGREPAHRRRKQKSKGGREPAPVREELGRIHDHLGAEYRIPLDVARVVDKVLDRERVRAGAAAAAARGAGGVARRIQGSTRLVLELALRWCLGTSVGGGVIERLAVGGSAADQDLAHLLCTQ